MKKRIITITLVTLLVLSIAGFASASGISITSKSSSISKTGSSSVYISANTVTSTTASRITNVITLERLVGGSWTYYSSYSSYGTNRSTFSNGTSKSVISGYYYRVKTTHYAFPYSGASVSGASSSGSVLVS